MLRLTMGYLDGGTGAAGGSPSDIVEALVAPIEDPYLRAQFTSFAALKGCAA
jgi:hypothetical protein